MFLCQRGDRSVLVIRRQCAALVAKMTGKWCVYYLYTFDGIVGDSGAFVEVDKMYHDGWVERRLGFTSIIVLDDEEFRFVRQSAEECARVASVKGGR